MIEAGMYIALGFFSATLLALAIFPAFYKRAVRLTQEAITAVSPSSYAEVRAAQDFERASHALDVVRIETALENERNASASHRAEAGRLRARITELEASLENLNARLQSEDQKAEPAPSADTEQLKARLSETEQELANARAEMDLLKSREKDQETPRWLPAEDTMSLATITGLESQLATLKSKLARYEDGEIEPADTASTHESANELLAHVQELEKALVDADTKYIAAQSEVARLSVQLEQSDIPAEERYSILERDLKLAKDETARLTALVRDRERALVRQRGLLDRLRQDLKAAPDIARLRKELLGISQAVIGKQRADKPVAASAPTEEGASPKADQKPAKGKSEKTNSIVDRLVKSSLANAAQKAKISKNKTAGDDKQAPARESTDKTKVQDADKPTKQDEKAPSPSGKNQDVA